MTESEKDQWIAEARSTLYWLNQKLMAYRITKMDLGQVKNEDIRMIMEKMESLITRSFQ